MANNRRNSTQPRASRSDEDAHLTSPTTAGLPPLSPPRPFFLSSRNDKDRGSYSSADTLDTGSDSDVGSQPLQQAPVQAAPQIRQRNPQRRRSSNPQGPAGYAAVEPETPTTGVARDPFSTPSNEQGGWSPTALYDSGSQDSHSQGGHGITMRSPVAGPGARAAPPSSFAFPFQAYPGNADPGMAIPGVSRRSSVDSLRRPPSAGAGGAEYGSYPPTSPGGAQGGYGHLAQDDLGRPQAPFMAGQGGGEQQSPSHSRRTSFHSEVYSNSAAGAMQSSPALDQAQLPRVSSTASFRAPFLSPASRPQSSFWTPPAFPYGSTVDASGSLVALPLGKRPPMPSSRLAQKLTKEEKPWLGKKDTGLRISWWLTVGMMFVGIGVGAVVCWRAYVETKIFSGSTCSMLNEDYRHMNSLSDNWNYEIGLGGFGNGEFEAMRQDDRNLFFKSDGMHIRPTFVADEQFSGDWNALTDGSQQNGLDLGDSCKNLASNADNTSVCSAGPGSVPPVFSARINTKGRKGIKFGRVEVKAKLPVGDWLWPAIWMLPADDKYGPWPASGEIDIMEARGNAPAYPNGGNNVVRSTMNYGPFPTLIKSLFGWQEFKRTSLADDFHTYALEWDHKFMRFFIDTRLHAMLEIDTTKTNFFKRGGFPATARNNTATEVVVPNPWGDNNYNAPYDQEFYLIIDLAVGGTSGWFPDQVGDKPWYDSANSAMSDFTHAHDTWTKTWPKDGKQDFVIQSVKMEQRKGDGTC